MLATTQHQIAKRIADVAVLILIWNIAEPIHAAANPNSFEVIAASQGFACSPTQRINLERRATSYNPRHGTGTSFAAHHEIVRVGRLSL